MQEENNYISAIVSEIQSRLSYALSRHSRVMLVRYDLAFPSDVAYTDNGMYLRSFLNKLRQNLRRKGLDPIDLWSREQNSGINPHFHCVVLLNGNKVQRLYAVLPLIERLWASTIGSCRPGLVHYCLKNYDGSKSINGCRLTRHDKELYTQCQDWLNYMAKQYSKGNAPPNAREYGGSRLTGLQKENLQPFSF